MATSTASGNDLFQQAICAWESAVASGVKMQEESAGWLREMVYQHEFPVRMVQ